MSRNYDVRTATPWGRADCATRFTRGITFYSTPGHGGFKVSKKLNKRIPFDFQTASFAGLGVNGWYEEDEDAAIVIVFFADFREGLFSAEQVKAAHASLKASRYLAIPYARHFTCTDPIEYGAASQNVSLARAQEAAQ
jgi:hypothetical protein